MPITIAAPAKINLVLEVLSRRQDGYHEVRSIMQAVRLCDYLHFESAPDLRYSCDQSGWQADRSLVSRAAQALGMEIAADRRRLAGLLARLEDLHVVSQSPHAELVLDF